MHIFAVVLCIGTLGGEEEEEREICFLEEGGGAKLFSSSSSSSLLVCLCFCNKSFNNRFSFTFSLKSC